VDEEKRKKGKSKGLFLKVGTTSGRSSHLRKRGNRNKLVEGKRKRRSGDGKEKSPKTISKKMSALGTFGKRKHTLLNWRDT